MSTDTGVEAASDGGAAAAGLLAVVVVAELLVVTAGADCGGVVPHAPTNRPAASSTLISVFFIEGSMFGRAAVDFVHPCKTKAATARPVMG